MTQDDFVAALATVAASDRADPEARYAAIGHLSISYVGTKDQTIGGIVARYVMDESLPTHLRSVAYADLFAIAGRPYPPKEKILRFPEGIDWTLVRRYGDAPMTMESDEQISDHLRRVQGHLQDLGDVIVWCDRQSLGLAIDSELRSRFSDLAVRLRSRWDRVNEIQELLSKASSSATSE